MQTNEKENKIVERTIYKRVLSLSRTLLSYGILFSLIILIACNANTRTQDLDVPFVPTPQPVVDRMLELADVGPGDYVIDLGSGDGRIVIAAAELGATAHGIDLDPERIEQANKNARMAGVTDRVMFVEGDIFEEDFSEASVITMYLLSSVNRRLRPRLLEELRPGTRVVSHSFDMGDWEPEQTVEVEPYDSNVVHHIYFWIIPARVDGRWEWNIDGRPHALSVAQQYQQVDVTLNSGNGVLKTSNAVLRGKRISFMADRGNQHYVYSGETDGDRITGSVQIHTGDNHRIESWSATRTETR